MRASKIYHGTQTQLTKNPKIKSFASKQQRYMYIHLIYLEFKSLPKFDKLKRKHLQNYPRY